MHAAEFNAKVLAQCAQPGASIAAVAMARGLNAKLVRKWLAGRGLERAGLTQSGAGQPAMSLGAAAPASLADSVPQRWRTVDLPSRPSLRRPTQGVRDRPDRCPRSVEYAEEQGLGEFGGLFDAGKACLISEIRLSKRCPWLDG